MDRAAARIARAGLNDQVDAPTDPTAVETSTVGGDLVSAMVDSLVARRLFTAGVRLAQTANENIATALRVGGYISEHS
jgi:hypothetical protein